MGGQLQNQVSVQKLVNHKAVKKFTGDPGTLVTD